MPPEKVECHPNLVRGIQVPLSPCGNSDVPSEKVDGSKITVFPYSMSLTDILPYSSGVKLLQIRKLGPIDLLLGRSQGDDICSVNLFRKSLHDLGK